MRYVTFQNRESAEAMTFPFEPLFRRPGAILRSHRLRAERKATWNMRRLVVVAAVEGESRSSGYCGQAVDVILAVPSGAKAAMRRNRRPKTKAKIY